MRRRVMAQHQQCRGQWSAVSQAYHVVSWPCVALRVVLRVLQPMLCCIATQPVALPHCPPVTILFLYRDTIPPVASPRPPVTIQRLYRDPLTSQEASSHNTIHCIATQFPPAKLHAQNGYVMIQFPLYHDTVSAVAQISFCCTFSSFFFFFLFSHIFFSSFLLLKNTQKNIYPFFFSFSSTPNKFIKIYFI